ncbi:alpha/beta hydrolase [Alphaproteobacteria bacterium]|nr:alpha/beta hydrolase [Alphaproteobacteria bacterium]MDC0131446.1 alpha/beta hydrolase [Alphaproteobacteria bacterium]MDC0148680.1 alpha/beta hydrolase [Alphaproteobacteria bacterium]
MDFGRIDPELLDGLKRLQAAMPLGHNLADDLAGTRQAAASRNAILKEGFTLPEDVTLEVISFTGSQGHSVELRSMRPKQPTSPTLPLVYWMHGGGYILGSADQDDPLMAKFAHELGCIAVSVDYRLAPETPYPGPLNDAYEGLCHLVENAETYPIDTDRMVIGGASAGAGLAAGLALRVRDEAAFGLAGQVLLYPMIDDTNVAAPSDTLENTAVWSREANLYGWTSYLGTTPGGPDIAEYAAPARATDLSGLPPTYLPVGALDLFLDEDMDYAQRLLKAGNACELHIFPGAVHGFNGFMPMARISQICNQEIMAFVAKAIS